MARFCSLYSSSSGNSTFIGSSKTGVLIDAGVSAKKLKEALLAREIDPSTIGAIFITHEHSDHIAGLRILASTFKIPLYASEGTIEFLEQHGHINGKYPFEIMPREGVEIGDIFIKSFKTPHDAAQSSGYQITLPDGQKAAIATDIGHISTEIWQNIKGCSLVMLESNHDVGMLQNGPYPYYLKRRILSPIGHLSNADCAKTAAELIKTGTTRLFLGHLSMENNFPDLAFQESYAAICEIGAELSKDYILEVNKKENDMGIVRF